MSSVLESDPDGDLLSLGTAHVNASHSSGGYAASAASASQLLSSSGSSGSSDHGPCSYRMLMPTFVPFQSALLSIALTNKRSSPSGKGKEPALPPISRFNPICVPYASIFQRKRVSR